MKDDLGTCSYSVLYQELKKFSKNGEYFCKELLTVFQQRAELEINYAKGLQKLAGKLIKASKSMNNNSAYSAWSQVSDEMFSSADAHRILGNSFHQEAFLEIRQVLEEHTKRKRPLDNAIDKAGKAFVTNWNEQLKVKKKLSGLTREHEALFNFVENNKQMNTEKEKQKMLNRLTKSAELQAKVDEEYFNLNLDGHQIRVKWENTLKSCYQIIQELEKQRIEMLSRILNKYNLNMASFGQTISHCQKKLDLAIERVDVERDIQALVEETSITVEDNKAEFLMTDYFEEDSKSLMGKERRRDAMRSKLQRLEGCITKSKQEREALQKIVKTYTENPSFSNVKNLEETEQLLDETTLKLDLLEATHCKLSAVIAELEGKPKSLHRFSDSITKWKDKDCEHNVVRLSRPVRIKKTPFRSRMSLRCSIIYKGPANSITPKKPTPQTKEMASVRRTDITQKETPELSSEINGESYQSNDEEEQGAEYSSLGRCKVLYDFTSDNEDDLNIKEGDIIDVFQRDESGWWYGELNGERGHFPSTYVEDLPVLDVVVSSDA
ncbi:nostrin [Chanos chanos]|uniref:Osteoclast-stimulating factor 1 n=1 Tax=Chanos chanos TaxID=29144 RepID=A0A6J2WFQ7_CHACN|nr:nostrin [Chanos chanos]